MDFEEQKNVLTPTKIINPNKFTIFGLLAGLGIWLIDALIDVYIIEPDESLIESLFFADGTELWMRFLVLIVLTLVGYLATRTVRIFLNLNILLYKYQFELEELVKTRTEALKERTEQLEKLANTDALTEVYNRRKFIQISEHELNRFLRHKRSFSILMLDIDDFKKINDSYGHDVGDDVIKTIAKLVEGVTREIDCFARWGGEEFIILTPESDLEGRCVLANKIVNLIDSHAFDIAGNVTISIGLTSAAENDTDIDQIIKRADQALYKAKGAGKNQYMAVD